jgi:hypothetical protein
MGAFACQKPPKRGSEILNIFELINAPMTFDDYGNVYVDYELSGDLDMVMLEYITEEKVSYFLPKEDYEILSKIKVTLFEDYKEVFSELSHTRRPYYRMRGRGIDEQQAFEIIRRTDNFFGMYVESIINGCSDYLGSYNFDNWLIMKNHFPQGYGWVHEDGTIGTNSITQKYPSLTEMIVEWVRNLRFFPFLDLVIAITEWDECIPDIEGCTFESGVILGLHVHDGMVELLDKHETLTRYNDYNEKYGSNPERFENSYYEDNHIVQVDEQYLRRCIEAYGLNADEELSKVPEYVIKGGK